MLYWHVVRVNVTKEHQEEVLPRLSIHQVIDEVIKSDEKAALFHLDTLEISSDETYAFCRYMADSSQMLFIRQICEPEYDMLYEDWQFPL